MPATAHHDDIVRGFWFGVSPQAFPALIAGKGLPNNFPSGIFHFFILMAQCFRIIQCVLST